MRKLTATLLVLAFCLPLLPPQEAQANTEIKNAMRDQYPDMCDDLVELLLDCTMCHGVEMELNAYGNDLLTAELDFLAIEGDDSDGDGRTNIEEIAKDCSAPGDAVSATETATFTLIKALFE